MSSGLEERWLEPHWRAPGSPAPRWRHRYYIGMDYIRVAAVAAALTLASGVGFAQKGDAAKGKEVFSRCGGCHRADSTEKKIGPGLKGLFGHQKLANGKPTTDANVRAQIDDGGKGMPAYKDTLTDQEKADLMAYLKTL